MPVNRKPLSPVTLRRARAIRRAWRERYEELRAIVRDLARKGKGVDRKAEGA